MGEGVLHIGSLLLVSCPPSPLGSKDATEEEAGKAFNVLGKEEVDATRGVREVL